MSWHIRTCHPGAEPSLCTGGIIASWNAGAQRTFGCTVEEVVGRPIGMLIPPDRQDEESVIIDRPTRGESVQYFETVRDHEGRSADPRLSSCLPGQEPGQIIGASKVVRDITEHTRTDEALRQAQAELAHISGVTTMGELSDTIAT